MQKMWDKMKTRLLIVFTILTLPLLVQSVHSFELDTSSFSLKQQIKEGWDMESLFCHNDQVLILKITDESPACVNPETKEKLLERGWAILTPKDRLYDIEKTLSDKDCVDFGRWLDEFVDGNFNENNLIFDLPVSDELSQRIYDFIPYCIDNDSGGFFYLNTKHFIDFEKLEKPSSKRISIDSEKLETDVLHTDHPERFCAYVGAERLSDYELQRIQFYPNQKPLKFLNFTDDHLSQVPILKEIVDNLAASEFPLNDRGYVIVNADELQNIKDYLSLKSNSQTLSSNIVVDNNLYIINGMTGSPVDPNGELLNLQFGGLFEDRKDDFTEDIKKDPSKRYVILTEDELEEIKPIKNAIDQIGTWKMSMRESKDVGDANQRVVMDFIESESIRQMGPEPKNQTSYFYYDDNYYRPEFVIC